MKTRKMILAAIVTALICQMPFAAMAADVTIVGEVNDTYQIVSDGRVYDVAENQIGEDLVLNYIGEKVKVLGAVTERDGENVIEVKSFVPVEE